jgi:hypothetical protein
MAHVFGKNAVSGKKILRTSFADPSLIVRCDLLVGGLLYLGVWGYCEPGKSDRMTKADYIRSIIYFDPEEVHPTVSLPMMREACSYPACRAGEPIGWANLFFVTKTKPMV